MKLAICTKFDLGQQVYLKVDPELGGIIIGILVRPGNLILYYVGWSDHEEATHYECELLDEKNFNRA